MHTARTAEVNASATPASPRASAPRLTALPSRKAAPPSLAELQAQHDLLVAEHHAVLGRLAMLEWQMRAVLARVGSLPPIPDHLAAYVGVEPVGDGCRQTLDRSALIAAAADGRL